MNAQLFSKRSLLFFLLGFLPLPAGFVLDRLLMAGHMPPLAVVAFLLLCLWALLAGWLSRPDAKAAATLIPLNFAAFVTLVLLLFQILVRRAMFPGLVGVLSQLFYLPLLNLGGTLTFFSPSFAPAYAACFLLLLAASLLGWARRRR